MKKLIVITGPTAVGKTELCLGIARELGIPIINADSRQLFRELKIGTASPTPEQLQLVRHYFVGTLNIGDYYSASMYEEDVMTLLDTLFRDSDYALLKRPNVHVALNPASNMKLANGFAPAGRMLKEGIHLCLGTDGPASNNSLNLFSEMRLLSLSQKGVTRDAVTLTAADTLRLATKNGAEAIGREDLGSVEAGKTADLILIDENAPNLRPDYNLTAALVYSATGCEVSDVMIGGKMVMRDRQLTTIDEERVLREVERIAARYR